MSLVRIGNGTFNFGLVTEIREFNVGGKAALPRVEISFLFGCMAALEGDEALALRAYLIKHSAIVTPPPDEPDFGADPLPFPAESAEEGA